MNTQTQVLRLDAGQALPHPQRGGAVAVLAEGELVLQGSARWIGGTVVWPAPERLAAPAMLPADGAFTLLAARPCVVVVQPAPGRAGSRLDSAAAWIRGLLQGRGRAAGGPARSQPAGGARSAACGAAP